METKERIISLLAYRLGYDETEINENQDFINDLGVDSLDMVEIVMDIEKEFGLKVEDKEIAEIKTVSDLIKKVDELRMGR
jgi:acyl carrier protein